MMRHNECCYGVWRSHHNSLFSIITRLKDGFLPHLGGGEYATKPPVELFVALYSIKTTFILYSEFFYVQTIIHNPSFAITRLMFLKICISGMVTAFVLLLVKLIFGKRMSASWHYYIWLGKASCLQKP